MKIVKKAQKPFLRVTLAEWVDLGNTGGWRKKYANDAARKFKELVELAGGPEAARKLLHEYIDSGAADLQVTAQHHHKDKFHAGLAAALLGSLALFHGSGAINIIPDIDRVFDNAVSKVYAHEPSDADMPDGSMPEIPEDPSDGSHTPHSHPPDSLEVAEQEVAPFKFDPPDFAAQKTPAQLMKEYQPGSKMPAPKKDFPFKEDVKHLVEDMYPPNFASIKPITLNKTAGEANIRFDEETWVAIGKAMHIL